MMSIHLTHPLEVKLIIPDEFVEQLLAEATRNFELMCLKSSSTQQLVKTNGLLIDEVVGVFRRGGSKSTSL